MRVDIRSLLAATVVAAFAASTWQVDPGWAVALTSILAACGSVRIGQPEGESSIKATSIVGMCGGVALVLGWSIQYLAFGLRPGLLWGTVAFTCVASSIAAIATHSPVFARWMQKTLMAAALFLIVAFCVRYYQTRHSQFLMARQVTDVGYPFPGLGVVDLEPSGDDSTPLRVRMRVLLGVAEVNSLLVKREMKLAQWEAASKIDTLLDMSMERTKVEASDIPEVKFTTQPRLYIWQSDLNDDSLSKILRTTDSGSVTLSCTRVTSYEGLSKANKLREIVFFDMQITDELIDELSKLPSLLRVKFWDNAKPSDVQLARLKEAIPGLVVDCVARREQQLTQ